jgi:hypothetical protein
VARQKLIDDIKQNPTRIYRSPGDVLRDRRFSDVERVEILRAWQGSISDVHDLGEIGAMIVSVEGRLYSASDHAAE